MQKCNMWGKHGMPPSIKMIGRFFNQFIPSFYNLTRVVETHNSECPSCSELTKGGPKIKQECLKMICSDCNIEAPSTKSRIDKFLQFTTKTHFMFVVSNAYSLFKKVSKSQTFKSSGEIPSLANPLFTQIEKCLSLQNQDLFQMIEAWTEMKYDEQHLKPIPKSLQSFGMPVVTELNADVCQRLSTSSNSRLFTLADIFQKKSPGATVNVHGKKYGIKSMCLCCLDKKGKNYELTLQIYKAFLDLARKKKFPLPTAFHVLLSKVKKNHHNDYENKSSSVCLVTRLPCTCPDHQGRYAYSVFPHLEDAYRRLKWRFFGRDFHNTTCTASKLKNIPRSRIRVENPLCHCIKYRWRSTKGNIFIKRTSEEKTSDKDMLDQLIGSKITFASNKIPKKVKFCYNYPKEHQIYLSDVIKFQKQLVEQPRYNTQKRIPKGKKVGKKVRKVAFGTKPSSHQYIYTLPDRVVDFQPQPSLLGPRKRSGSCTVRRSNKNKKEFQREQQCRKKLQKLPNSKTERLRPEQHCSISNDEDQSVLTEPGDSESGEVFSTNSESMFDASTGELPMFELDIEPFMI